MTEQQTIHRIRALLAKAEGTDNPHEAEVFMAKVRELLDRHQLTMTDLSQESDPMGQMGIVLPYREDWLRVLISLLAEYFDCAAAFTTTEVEGVEFEAVILVGREGARVSCQGIIPYIWRTLDRICALDPSVSIGGIGGALSWRIMKLVEQRQPVLSPGTALVPVREAVAHLMEMGDTDSTEVALDKRPSLMEMLYAESIGLGLQVDGAGQSDAPRISDKERLT